VAPVGPKGAAKAQPKAAKQKKKKKSG